MGFPVLCSLKGLFLRFYEPKICNYLYAKQKEKSILILMVCYFLTIFYIISNWYYFDGFNIAVNFYLEDKINKTKSTHTQKISFVYWKCKISLITFFSSFGLRSGQLTAYMFRIDFQVTWSKVKAYCWLYKCVPLNFFLTPFT